MDPAGLHATADDGAGQGACRHVVGVGPMRAVRRFVSAVAAVASTTAAAAAQEGGGRPDAPASEPSWEFSVTVMPTIVRDGENYTSAVAAADHGSVHLEARVNYESIGARSAFVGWTFSGGEAVTWEVTPLLGGAWGDTRAFVPGAEASVAWRWLDFYIEAEYVRDSGERNDSYFYAWTELGASPFEWLRLGLAGQRTRTYQNERDIQRGPFVQFTWRRLTIGAYWFNPGSSAQVFVGSIGATF